MSGGTIKPSHFSLRDIADSIREESDTPLHLALANHLDKVAEAVQALDKELSGDTGTGDADDAIRSCINEADN